MTNYLWMTSLVALAQLLASCRQEVGACNPYVRRGEHFDLRVVSSEEPTFRLVPSQWLGLPSCPLEDVPVGGSFDVELQDLLKRPPEECKDFVCPKDFPTPATPLSRERGDVAMSYVCVNTMVKVDLGGGCELGRYVGIHNPVGQRELYTSQDAGTSNPLTMFRALFWDPSVNCPDLTERFPESRPGQGMLCVDVWTVSLSELPAR
jgi:hypothetical protein